MEQGCNVVKAIVLAAGLGTRLKPLTCNRPKPLLEVGGKPILQRTIDQILEIEEVEEVRVVIHAFSGLVKQFIETHYPTQNIRCIYQEKPRGTGDAVKCAIEGIEEEFMVVFGDLVFERDELKEAVNAFKQTEGFDALACGFKAEDYSKYGVFTLTENGKAINIIEKPDQNEIKGKALVNAGFFIFPKDMREYLNGIDLSVRKEIELTDAIRTLIDKHNLYVHELKGKWFDIGYPWLLLEANKHLLEKEQNEFQVLGTVEEGVKVYGKIHVAKSARIRSGTYIEGPAYFDEGADIGPNTYIRGASYFGKNSRVGNACEVKNSIIYANTHAAHLSYIGDSILGEKCNLGAGTITANLRHDNRPVKVTVKDKRISSGRRKLGVIMGDDVKTGIGVSILPGVKIGCGARINADETVNRDIQGVHE